MLGNPRAWFFADIYSQAFHITNSSTFEEEQDKILDFSSRYSALVKDYVKTRSDEKKSEVEKLYQELDKLLSAGDPRRITINHLKNLVN